MGAPKGPGCHVLIWNRRGKPVTVEQFNGHRFSVVARLTSEPPITRRRPKPPHGAPRSYEMWSLQITLDIDSVRSRRVLKPRIPRRTCSPVNSAHAVNRSVPTLIVLLSNHKNVAPSQEPGAHADSCLGLLYTPSCGARVCRTFWAVESLFSRRTNRQTMRNVASANEQDWAPCTMAIRTFSCDRALTE